jgi:glycosyltransferase involved in cell wall biosynthesis
LDEIEALRSAHPPSSRKVVLVKGYQGWAGRALVALRALERCAELLEGREVVVFSATSEVAIAAELFTQRTGVPARIVPEFTAHREMLALHAAARLYVGLSISDAISLSLLEAMAMGAFPVQSCTSCGDEWVEHGRTGLLVPPEDVDVVEEALRRALADDALVDGAARENWQTVKQRLDWRVVRDTVIAAYQRATAQ